GVVGPDAEHPRGQQGGARAGQLDRLPQGRHRRGLRSRARAIPSSSRRPGRSAAGGGSSSARRRQAAAAPGAPRPVAAAAAARSGGAGPPRTASARASRPASGPSGPIRRSTACAIGSAFWSPSRRAVLTHRGLTNNARLAAEAIGLRAGDVLVNPMPYFHVAGGGMITLGLVQTLGIQVVMPRFDPAAQLELIEAHRGTIIGGVPTMLTAL